MRVEGQEENERLFMGAKKKGSSDGEEAAPLESHQSESVGKEDDWALDRAGDWVEALERAGERFELHMAFQPQSSVEEPFRMGIYIDADQFCAQQIANPSNHLVWLYENEVLILGTWETNIHLAPKAGLEMLNAALNFLLDEGL